MNAIWLLFALGCAGVAVFFARRRRPARPYQRLASRQPERAATEDRPLGTEALDLDAVRRAQRRNESLERAHTNWTRGRSGILGAAAADTHIAPLADDETYAKRFHAAYMNKKDTPK